ncbi:MAG: hypothetical protein ACI8Y7_001209 [Candidatus Woesearchaeota archaeon]|jgi:hypothetical protein
MKIKYISITIIIILIAIVGIWLAAPLFYDKTVHEDMPVTLSQSTGAQVTTAQFTDADASHKAAGTVLLIDGEQRLLRFEKFKATNGPDLRVYLASDEQATEFIDLGKLKGNIGDQNYEIPADTDLEKYQYVLIWCRAFSVLFGSAQI